MWPGAGGEDIPEQVVWAGQRAHRRTRQGWGPPMPPRLPGLLGLQERGPSGSGPALFPWLGPGCAPRPPPTVQPTPTQGWPLTSPQR